MTKIYSTFDSEKNRTGNEGEVFLKNFSLRSRNALATSGILNQSELENAISSGEIFISPKLGLSSIKEIIVWAWNNRHEDKIKSTKTLHLTIEYDDFTYKVKQTVV